MPIRKRGKVTEASVKPLEIMIDKFNGGVKTLLDQSRLDATSVYQAQNMMLDQDGVWRVRYGSQSYGQTLTGPIDGIGRATVYNTNSTMTNYLFVMDNGTLKYCTDGGPWSSVAGRTFTVGANTQLTQISSRLYITNGKDTLSYLDLTNFTLTIYTALSTPGTVTLARTVLTTGSYNVYYKITAVKATIGETAASAEATITVNKPRTQWKTDGTEHIDLSWTAVTGADAYNIYYSNQPGQEVFLDSTSAITYSDTGSTVTNPYQAAPPTDGTAGTTGAVMCLSGNRIWTTADPAFPYRISWTGTAQYLGSFNPFYGGGYIDLNLGGDEKVIGLQQYRDGKGNQTVVAFTTSPASGGSVWFISLSAITVGSTSVVIPSALSQGTIGSTSARGLVQANNNIYYPSIKGFQTLGSAPSVLNVLVTSEVSTAIRPSVKAINNQFANLICGYYYYGRIFFSVPFGSSVNNQVWVLDLERQAWCLPWTIGVKQFLEYTDSAGQIHLLAVPVTGTKLIEFSENFQGDSGTAFSTNLQSGLIPWNQNHFSWAWIAKFYGEFSNPRGNITLTVSGTGPNKTLTTLKSITITNTVSSSGVGSDLVGNFEVGASNNSPKTFSQASSKKVLYINKALNNLQWQITSSDINAAYALMELGIEGNLIESGDPSSWRK